MIAADDVAPSSECDRLGFVVDLVSAPGQEERDEGRGIVEHEFAHEFVGALAYAQNVEHVAGFEFGEGLGADHAAVGDDADAVDRKALAQPVDHRDQAADVGGVARPHLRAHRSAVAIQQHGQDHLVEVGPMVLGEAAPPERLTAGALEIEARRVHEHQIERAEQVPPPREKVLFQDVLQAARRIRRGAVLLGLVQLLAEPSHRPIQVMQVQPVRARDPIILPPAIRRAVRAAGKQAMQHGEEDRSLQREVMVARAGEVLDDRATAGLLPQPFERQRRPDPSRRARRHVARCDGLDEDGLFGEPGARAQQPLQLSALLQIVEAPERGDHLLAHRPAFAPAFDDLEIGAAA